MAELQIDAYRQQYGLDWSIVSPAMFMVLAIIYPDNAMVIPSLMMRIIVEMIRYWFGEMALQYVISLF